MRRIKIGEPILFIVQPKVKQSQMKIQETYVIKNLSPDNQKDIEKEYIQQVVKDVMQNNRNERRKKSRRK